MFGFFTRMHYTTWILALVLLLTVKGSRVAVAKVHFTQSHYTIKENNTVCVDVVNDLPTSERFAVSFSYSVVLLGGEALGRPTETRTSSVFFLANQRSSSACIVDRVVNDSPCERAITGTIRLINSTKVAIGTLASATITIQDDDVISATFGKSVFMIPEGFGSMELFPFVNISLPSVPQLHLLIVSSNHMNAMVEQSIFFTGSVLTSPQNRQPLQNLIVDDDVALEETEYIALELTMTENPQCMVHFLPFNTTTIKVIDDDDVRIELKTTQEITREGDHYRVCVYMSNVIARDLKINVNIHTETADLVDIGQESATIKFVLRSFNVDRKECSYIQIIQDHIIETEESFAISLSLGEEFPEEIMQHLTIDTSHFTIKIKDTSTCHDHMVGTNITESTLYVLSGRTLCFTCSTCHPSKIIWSVVSFEGSTWAGSTGERLMSSQNSTDQGMVFPNGTLLVTNSSTLFSTKVSGVIIFNEKGVANSSKKYNVLLGDAAVVIDLNISIEGSNIYKIICKYRGIPQPRMLWLINETPAKEDKNIRTVEGKHYFYQSTLTVRNIISVQYKCMVSNSFGEDSSEGSVQHATPIINSSQKFCAMYLIHLAVLLFSQI